MSQWTVLAAAFAIMGGGLWVSARIIRGSPRPVAVHSDAPVALAGDSEPAESRHELTKPAAGPERNRAERPIDEARCRARPLETAYTVSVRDGLGNAVPGSVAALIECAADGPRFQAALDWRSLDEGSGCLRTRWSGESLLAVFAPGYLPTTRRVSAAIGERVDVEAIVLEPGATIEGTVSVGGKPVARAEVEIQTCAACELFEVAGLAYAWRHDRFVLAKATAETGDDGTYRVGGLDAAEHTARLRAVRRRDVAVDVSRAPLARVTAPRTGVDFALPAARLELEFRSDQGPVCCVDVQIEAGDRQFTRSADEGGRLMVMLQPALAYPLIISRRGFETKRTQLRGLIHGERLKATIELEPQLKMASVLVEDEGKAGDSATVSFRPRFPLMHGSAFERNVSRDSKLGGFLVSDVPNGAWSVTLRSGQAIRGVSTVRPDEPMTARTNCEADALVDVPTTGMVRVKVFPRPAPMASIIARDRFGMRVRARVKVFDARGEEVEGVFVAQGKRPELLGSSEPDAPDLVYSTVCGGPFEWAVFAEGFVQKRLPHAFGVGRPTLHEITLEPK